MHRERVYTGNHRRVVVSLTAAMTALALLVGSAAPATAASGFPSWGDVQTALGDVRRNQALQTEAQGLISRLETEAAAATAAAEARGADYQRAQDAADRQSRELQELRADTNAARMQAEEARRRAGGALHELVHTTRGDVRTTLLASPGGAEDFLQRLGMSSKVSEISRELYADALRAQKSVESLTAQSAAAEAELSRRQVASARAFDEAQAAAERARAATDSAAAHLDELKAQLLALQQRSLDVRARYDEGVARAAAEAAAAAARAAASGQASVNASTGWARPVSGAVVSGFGMRLHPIYQVYKLHTGADLVAGCGTPIFAATGGTVTYSGPNGDLGNFIQLDHGGVSTGYAHIMNGGLLVRVGQRVSAGQLIARAGTTGGSTGCHLHYIVRVNGALVDPVPFMRERGAPLG